MPPKAKGDQDLGEMEGEEEFVFLPAERWEHYCFECAKSILQHDTQKLQEIARAVEGA